MKKQILITAVLSLTGLIFCQENFTENVVSGLTAIERSAAAWGDYDNDGDLDIFITGSDGGGNISDAITKLYRNDGGNNFTDIDHNLPQTFGRFDWGDYDNDGYIDIALTGMSKEKGDITHIYRNNNGDGSFTFAVDLGNFNDGSNSSNIEWGDYDNDGDLDLLVTGDRIAGTKYDPITKLFRNDSGIFMDSGIELPNVSTSTAVWGDYNNDGYLDLLMTGTDYSGPVTIILKNETGEYFTDIESELIGVSGLSQSAVWSDYDNDGDLDIFIAGDTDKNTTGVWGIGVLYRNDSNDNFVHIDTFTGSNYLGGGSISLGDCDNNGFIDFILTGVIDPSWIDFTSLYLNNGSFGFSQNFRSMRSGSVAWADYDNDGDLDFWLNGYDGTAPYAGENFSEINRNNKAETTGIINNSPVKPSGLYSSLVDNNVRIFWNKSTDVETPQNGLTYNIYVGTESKTGDVLNPMSKISDGFRKIARKGNVDHNTTWAIKDLPDGIYYYGTQAVDHGFAGSEFSTECIFVKGEHTLNENTIIELAAQTEMRLLEGSRLKVSSNCSITIPYNSKLILEDNSELIIETNATLTLNPYSVTECKNGSIITVETGGTLTSYESYITGNPVWNGIEARVGSSVRLIYTSVKNAQNALSAIGSVVNVTGSSFVDCYNGVSLTNCTGYTLNNNYFKGMYSGYDSGISLTECGGSITGNTVTNFGRGVILTLSSVNLIKNKINANRLSGVYVTGYNVPQMINSSEKIELNNEVKNNGDVQVLLIYHANVYLTGGYNNIYSDPINVVPSVPCIYTAGWQLEPQDQLDNKAILPNVVRINADRNYWGYSGVISDNFDSFFGVGINTLHQGYSLVYEPYAVDPYTAEPGINPRLSSNEPPSAESKLLSTALMLEDKGNVKPAIKKYEQILSKYPDSSEAYVANARLPELYLQAERNVNELLMSYDEALESDVTTDKKFFKQMKITANTKSAKYDEAISIAEEMKAEAENEAEVTLADLSIAIAETMKNNGKSNVRAGSNTINDLLAKLTGNGGEEQAGEPSFVSESVLPSVNTLYQNYPNPFNPVTQIKFDLTKTANVRLGVYNINGQKVAELANGTMNAGNHAVEFDGSNLNSGVYYYTLEVDGIALTKKMVLTK